MKSLRCALSSSEDEGLVASQTAPNKGLELTASSVRCAPAFCSSSGLALGATGTQEPPRQGTPKTKGISKTKGIQGERHSRHKASKTKDIQKTFKTQGIQDTRHFKTAGTAKTQGLLSLPAGEPHGSPPRRRGAAEHLTKHWSRPRHGQPVLQAHLTGRGGSPPALGFVL